MGPNPITVLDDGSDATHLLARFALEAALNTSSAKALEEFSP